MIRRMQQVFRGMRGGPWLATLLVLAVLLAFLFGGLAVVSFRFAPDIAPADRPIPQAIAMLGLAFAGYLGGIFAAVRARQDKRLLAVVLLGSVLFRVVSLYSWPILEIDIYRYLWDGAVTLEGVSPYRFSPRQVRSAAPRDEIPDDLNRLVQRHQGSASMGTILSRVHYAELPTIYPPVSQAVFAATALLTPSRAGVLGRIVAMKIVLVVFDLATLAVVVALLRRTGRHVGWSVAYGWCPLVIKEIANTGHLDSVAVFLTVLALYLAVGLLPGAGSDRAGSPRAAVWASASAVTLALAVGAKFYPVVLAPLFLAIWVRSLGGRAAAALGLVFAAATLVLLRPMMPSPVPAVGTMPVVSEPADAPPPPPVETAMTRPQNPAAGLAAFLGRWEMNDFLFLLVVENLRPTAGAPPSQRPWFSIVPEEWKIRLLAGIPPAAHADPARVAFLVARFVTAGVFLAILAALVWRARLSEDPRVWLRAAFLALAWLWLLSPTQNPWYWIWALPLVTFARSKAWLAVSGLTMIYYLRFWLAYHWPDQPVLGTPYSGAAFFDFVVPWIEYGPWFAWLAWEAAWRRGGCVNSGDM